MFGSDISPIDDRSGYETIEMELCCRDGGTCVIRRKLNEKKVSVIGSTIEQIGDGEYRTASYKFKQLYLTLIGIEEPVNLIAKQDYSKTQKLSWRMLSPIFFIPEEQIFRSDSIVTTPGFRNITVAISALKYCFDGKKVMIPNKEGKDASISRNAIAIYISKQIQQLMDEKERIQEIIASRGTVNIEETLSEQVTKLEHINQETQRLFDQSRMMLQSKIQISDRLRELVSRLIHFYS